MSGPGRTRGSAQPKQAIGFRVEDEDAGLRLDQLLAKYIPDMSRRKARVLLTIGGVFVDNKRVKVASRVPRTGQRIRAYVGGALARALRGEDLPPPTLAVIYEDKHLLVVDKPSGVLTAPTPESDRGNIAYFLQQTRKQQLYVVHRLDMLASGLLALAKTKHANNRLSAQFRDHSAERIYWVGVDGAPNWQQCRCDQAIAGKRARSHFQLIERFGNAAAVLEARLETGRTHQIRLHTRHLGHAVLADPQYGDRSPHQPPRLALHARSLRLRHPVTDEDLLWQCELPPELAHWCDQMRTSRFSND